MVGRNKSHGSTKAPPYLGKLSQSFLSSACDNYPGALAQKLPCRRLTEPCCSSRDEDCETTWINELDHDHRSREERGNLLQVDRERGTLLALGWLCGVDG